MMTREKTSLLKTPDGYTVCFYGWPLKTFDNPELAKAYMEDSALDDGIELARRTPVKNTRSGTVYPSILEAAKECNGGNVPSICKSVWSDSGTRAWDLVVWP